MCEGKYRIQDILGYVPKPIIGDLICISLYLCWRSKKEPWPKHKVWMNVTPQWCMCYP